MLPPQNLAKDPPRLFEDLLAMCDEEERIDLPILQKSLVIERRNEGLPRSSSGDDEVPGTPDRPCLLQFTQDWLLPLFRLEVEGEEVARVVGLRKCTREAPGRGFRTVKRLEPI